ncbi:serpin B4-like [Perognathus longimembris pacificus]|uniref:serpin B4-like n=1 Tax=Perognathus longimembris pacificus TaxID=214514 RepID=UPI002018A02E|nr:serpin B4-like [Perognathus longimembris pacificus]
MNSLSEANTKFTVGFLRELGTSADNAFFSPFSISSALSMVSLGAKGNTAREIKDVLHFNEVTGEKTKTATTSQAEESGIVHQQFQKLLKKFNKPSDAFELRSANSLYGEKTFQFIQEYLDNVKKFYLANVESLDFANNAEESRKKINAWVESQTNDKIKDLFPDGSLDQSTILVLVNAIYFKGQWLQKFEKENTQEGTFWLNKDVSKPVQMMSQTKHFRFASLEDEQAKILEIPYKGKELSMVLLLPNEVDGLQKLQDSLTAEKLIAWTSAQNMSEIKLYLRLPRFKLQKTYDLKATLQRLGMVDAFSPHKADLSGMSQGRRLAVTKAFHQCLVEVTEEGTEAAAATGVSIAKTSALIREEFCCDHPFLFFIRENKTNLILFFGRFASP